MIQELILCLERDFSISYRVLQNECDLGRKYYGCFAIAAKLMLQ